MILRCCMNRNYRPVRKAEYDDINALYKPGWKLLERALNVKDELGGDENGKDNINESKPQ